MLGCLGASLAAVVVAFELAGVQPIGAMVLCWFFGFMAVYGGVTASRHGVIVAKDRLATVCIWGGASFALFPLIEIILQVVVKGLPVVAAHFPAFFVHSMPTAGPTDPVWKGGVEAAIIGSVEQVGLATLYTIPVAVLTATFLSESATMFSRLVRTIVDCMMGTPSIIAGLFVYLFWVQPRHTNGYSGFAASIALAVLMLPIMIRTAEEVIRVVPDALREAALALGAPRWRVCVRVVLPTVRSGLITAVILGIALAVGETAPTLFTAHGPLTAVNVNPFHGPQSNLPLMVFTLIFISSDNYVRDAWGAAFVLVFLVLALFVVARLVGSSRPGRHRLHLRRRPTQEVVSP